MRRVWVVSSDALGVDGELLITLYDEGLTGMTVAYRERPHDSWGPPHIAQERT